MSETITQSSDDRQQSRRELTMVLAKGGMEDFHVISQETAQQVLTDRRHEIMRTLKQNDPESVRELARQLGRDKAAVSRDLGDLAENGIVTYEKNGRAKRPVLTHDRIIVEPLL